MTTDSQVLYPFHIVLRPPIDILPSPEAVLSVVQNLKGTYKFAISQEKGSSTGDEPYNHYDIVLHLKENRRVDALKRTLCDVLEIPKDKRKNIKCYAIDENRSQYQIGYCLKEGIGFNTNFNAFELADGKAAYEEKGPMNREKFTTDKWNIGDVAREYEKWLRGNTDRRGFNEKLTEDLCRRYWRSWKNQNKKNIDFTVYQRINQDKLFEYICDDE